MLAHDHEIGAMPDEMLDFFFRVCARDNRENGVDGASLLHHLPAHAAAQFMLGLVYVRKGHHRDGIALMEQALERCPWNRHWRSDLAQAGRRARERVVKHWSLERLARRHAEIYSELLRGTR